MEQTNTNGRYKHPGLSSSLDPQESSSHDGYATQAIPDDTDIRQSAAFRHLGWRDRRIRTYAALSGAFIPRKRLAAFEGCGEGAYLQQQADNPEKYRIRCTCCHDRWCVPCQRVKSRIVAGNLYEHFESLPPDTRCRFITLTLRSTDTPLSEQLDRLYKAYQRLRRWAGWHKTQDGGLAVLELTLNRQTHLWHPHLHVISEGRFIDQKELSKQWRKVTGDSYIVDVRAARTQREVGRYITKYLTKVVSAEVTRDQERFVEAIQALNGRKMLATYGTWNHLRLTTPSDNLDWVDVCSLAEAIRRAKIGDQKYQRILMSLRDTLDEHPSNPETMDPIPKDT